MPNLEKKVDKSTIAKIGFDYEVVESLKEVKFEYPTDKNRNIVRPEIIFYGAKVSLITDSKTDGFTITLLSNEKNDKNPNGVMLIGTRNTGPRLVLVADSSEEVGIYKLNGGNLEDGKVKTIVDKTFLPKTDDQFERVISITMDEMSSIVVESFIYN